MRRCLPVALLTVVMACTTGPDEADLHTVLVGFDHVPTQQDLTAVQRWGGDDPTVIPIAQSITVRTSKPAASYLGIPGVTHSADLGPASNPLNSVFITVVNAPIPADTAFVRAAGARLVGILPPTTIASEMPLHSVAALGDYARFVSAAITADDYTPQ